MRNIGKIGNPKTKLEIVRLALLASYNENRKENQVITNEDAPKIWEARAKTVLRELAEVEE